MSDEALIAAAEAPANIALIKYMGKQPADLSRLVAAGLNVPLNSSLSFTLDHLRSRVEIWPGADVADAWQPLEAKGWQKTELSQQGQSRYLDHFDFLKQKFGLRGHYLVRSANNFPSDCGIASSASSFAALTMATYAAAKVYNPRLDFSCAQLAELSRGGSGSSIRSFYAPYALWNESGCAVWQEGPRLLHHQLVVVAEGKKAVSSSEAHKRVTTSLLFAGRPQRAEQRLETLQQALGGERGPTDWRAAFEIMWSEFWDMHSLFHTAKPAFRYMTPLSLTILSEVQDFWEKNGDGPLATLDAGPNVHLLYRADQVDQAHAFAAGLKRHQQDLTIIGSSGVTIN